MAVQLAKLQGEPQQRQGPLYQPTPQPMAPQEKSAAQQMTDMAANKAMTATVDKGASLVNEYGIQPATDAISGMFSSAAPTANIASQVGGATAAELAAGAGGEAIGTMAANAATPALTSAAGTAAGTGAAAAGGGAMAALGTAMPYVGAAMLAGKAFGLFSEGGKVNPMYANMGGLMPMLFDKAKEEGIPMGLASMLSKGGKTGPLYASGGSGTRIVRPYRLSDKGKTLKSREVHDYYLDNPKPLEIDNMGFGESFDYDNPNSDYYSNGGAVYSGMAGPLSKVEYKSAGGETYKLSYGGPISKGV